MQPVGAFLDGVLKFFDQLVLEGLVGAPEALRLVSLLDWSDMSKW